MKLTTSRKKLLYQKMSEFQPKITNFAFSYKFKNFGKKLKF